MDRQNYIFVINNMCESERMLGLRVENWVDSSKQGNYWPDAAW
ncbi:hypothetical protein OO184_13990 [Photorhabdus sp. APURE]|nr:hypothetical protein [Photorhabdus aballayi]MCW7549015.1 hypothetical protein [Photorhabdus aballayi]